LGLGLALKEAGKSVQMVLVDGVPASYKHLEGSDLILKKPSGEHDAFITVDCADFKRVGKVFEDFGQADINIDHHKTNHNYGDINLVDENVSSTAELLYMIFEDWNVEPDKDISHALLTGIYAARNFLGADYDLWGINTDPEHHEEFQSTEIY